MAIRQKKIESYSTLGLVGSVTVAVGQYCLVSLVRKHTNPYKMTMQHNVEMTCGAVRHSKARKTSTKFVDEHSVQFIMEH